MKNLSIVGRLGQEPELKYAQSGSAILSLSAAVDHQKRKQGGGYEKDTIWVRVTVFGKRAESLSKVLQKGMRVAASGEMDVRQYETKAGKAGVSVEIVASDVFPLFDRKEGGERGGGGGGFAGGGGFGSDTGGFESG